MRIDGALVERRLDELYAIGAEPDGGGARIDRFTAPRGPPRANASSAG